MTRNGPSPLPLLISYAAQLTSERQTKFLEGVKKYQQHTYVRTLSELPVVWQAGEARLLYAGDGKGTPLIVIPSMVNKSTILDLTAERSFVRWMAGQGFEVYLLDWGASLKDDGQTDFDAVISERLVPAAAFVAQRHSVSPAALGYCMGGTLLAGAVSVAPDLFSKMVFLAAPWDFEAGDRALHNQVMMSAPAGLTDIAQSGRLGATWVQAVFAALDPAQVIEKFERFAYMADGEDASRYVAAEDWLNDPVDLPGGVARTVIQNWYLKNQTVTGPWTVQGVPVVPEEIGVPSLVVMASKDRLVPPESSMSLYEAIPRAQKYLAETGHIGLLAGRRAVEDVWMPIRDFILDK